MRKVSVLLTIFVLLMAVVPFAAASGTDKVRVFLKFSSEPDTNIVNIAGGKVLHSYSIIDNVLAVELPANALNGVLNNPNIVGFEFDAEVHALGKPDRCTPWPACKDGGDEDPQPSQELPWGVDRIDADLATATGEGVTVCIVDTGIDKDHPDLQANIAGGINFVPKGRTIDLNKWEDDNGHGTHVAGTIAALDNSIGVVGVAPSASLLVVKALDRRGSGYLSDIIAGIEFCVDNGADVISMSLGTNSDILEMQNAVDAAYAAGVLLVAAAGNDYSGAVDYPGAYSSVIAVAATDINDNIASFSDVGPEVELAAPGVNIFSTYKNGEYDTKSVTSMATPHVSGVAALAIQTNPTLTNAEIRTLLQTTADDLGAPGYDTIFGYGLVDAELI
ncbi:S8 family peptidase [Candidatus Woesearchaeota archaeon]|nr:S8 family peptidase [Candidatus Woesearchaeota archaeon]